MKKIFLFATALLMSASMFAKTSVITYTAEEKLPETTDAGQTFALHLNAFYAADSTQLTVTHTFDEAESVGTITLDGEVAIIGDNAFYKTGLTSVTIPEGVTTIGKDAFYGCASLASVTLPDGLATIGEQAFCGTGLTSITLPESVTTMGKYAFSESGLTSITIPGGVTTIEENVFKSCPDLQSVILSEGITTIKMNTFAQCAALTSVTLPTSLTTIGEQAFVITGLTSIIIPASVTTIEMGAFAMCSGLASVTFLGNACQDAIGEMAFYEVGKDAPALLTLHGTWAKENQPDEDGNWYGGKFELSEDPTALPQMRAAVKATKVMTNGQVIFRAENKNFSILGQEVK